MLKFRCEHCEKKISVPDEYAGKRVRCPGCEEAVSVPEESMDGGMMDELLSLPEVKAGVSEVEVPSAAPLVNRPAEEEKPDVSFLGVFAYPFKGAGKYIILACLLIVIVRDTLIGIPMIGRAAMAIGLLFSAYVSALLLSIISSSANGDSEMPDWPNLSSWWDDVIVPVVSAYALVVIWFLPAIVYKYAANDFSAEIYWALIGLGCLVSPMVLLVAVLFGSLQAINPVLIMGSIFKILPSYLGAVALLLLVVGAEVLLSYVNFSFRYLEVLLGIYFSIVVMRILGLIYYKNEHKLGWF
ncbi:MAG: hypothetical protein JW936_11155 [Sedimentisphaerales bacterium]|nr:hypothetical protein [Sedimentisphaerales bacterium]